MESSEVLMLRAMVAVAHADGRLDTREVELIQDIYQSLSDRPLSLDEVRAAETANQDGDLLSDLAGAAGSLALTEREDCIKAAYCVLLADDRITGQERKTLKDFADVLKIPEIHFGAILEDVTLPAGARKPKT
jgi:tellurite resistance protein